MLYHTFIRASKIVPRLPEINIEAGNKALIFESVKKIPTGVTIQILAYLNKRLWFRLTEKM